LLKEVKLPCYPE